MGFFAITDPLQGDAYNEPSNIDFSVEKLDVNVWLLPLLFGRNAVLVDLGVRLKAGTTNLPRFDVAIPFRTVSGCLSDLSEAVKRPDVGALVFGETVTKPDGSVLDPHSDFAKLVPISPASSKRLDPLSNDTFSLWRVELQNAIPPGGEAYVRFRFAPQNLGRTVVWRRSLVRRVGALVDLHFYDPREAALVPEGSRYHATMKPTDRLNAFFIVLATLRLRKTSPELRYLRLLEARRWERYLSRATDLRRRGKFLVHYWRAPGDVGVDREFRAFLDLGRRTESIGWTTALSLVLATIVLMHLTLGDSAASESPVGRLWSSITGWLTDLSVGQISVLGGAGLFGVLATLSDALPVFGTVRKKCLQAFRKFEAWLYRKLADL